jgi:hypothetical protein
MDGVIVMLSWLNLLAANSFGVLMVVVVVLLLLMVVVVVVVVVVVLLLLLLVVLVVGVVLVASGGGARRACEPAAKPAIPGVILLHNGFVGLGFCKSQIANSNDRRGARGGGIGGPAPSKLEARRTAPNPHPASCITIRYRYPISDGPMIGDWGLGLGLGRWQMAPAPVASA